MRRLSFGLLVSSAAALALGVLPGCATAPNSLAPDTMLPSVSNTVQPPPQAILPASAVPPPMAAANNGPGTRMALLLPLRSTALGAAAGAVRDGFMAAFERDAAGVSVDVLETGDEPAAIVALYADAQADHDIVIGPLLRQAVTAIAQSGRVDKPTLALNQPDAPGTGTEAGDGDTAALPPNLLVMGLSVEDEARQMARWASADHPDAPAYAIYGQAPWQRRAARAFAAQRLSQGLPTKMAEVSGTSGDARIGDMVKLQMRLQAETAPLLFMALDFEAARELRAGLGTTWPAYGTSQLNPNVLAETNDTAPELNGVRLLDMPWQLQNDHAAVMVYPRQTGAQQSKLDPDLARLYALGIDAYRVAYAIALEKKTDFTIDGVTGRLAVRFKAGAAHFERTELPAVYRDGVVQPWGTP